MLEGTNNASLDATEKLKLKPKACSLQHSFRSTPAISLEFQMFASTLSLCVCVSHDGHVNLDYSLIA